MENQHQLREVQSANGHTLDHLEGEENGGGTGILACMRRFAQLERCGAAASHPALTGMSCTVWKSKVMTSFGERRKLSKEASACLLPFATLFRRSVLFFTT